MDAMKNNRLKTKITYALAHRFSWQLNILPR